MAFSKAIAAALKKKKKKKKKVEKVEIDAKKTITKVKKINKPYARKIQILTVLEQRARFAGKTQQAALAKKAKEQLRRQHGTSKKSKKS